MQTITTIGLDIHAGGQVIVRRQLKRRYVLTDDAREQGRTWLSDRQPFHEYERYPPANWRAQLR
jgi:hypothetical protein